MEINNRNYNLNPSFGSVKLANLTLKKVLPNGATLPVAAELHKLDAFDFPLLEKLYMSFCSNPPKYLVDIYENFKYSIDTANKMATNKRFLMIKKDGKTSALCEATITNNAVNLDYITNFDRGDGVKGSGTALIVNLVEFAKKAKKSVITLNAARKALDFYDKLGFEMINAQQDFKMISEKYGDFLKIFKPKYFDGN